jgi:transcriptional regulator with XRE-family HTH domain
MEQCQRLDDVFVAKPVGADKKRDATTLAKAIGAEITDLRKSRGWSQAEVAHLTGYTEKWIRSTEMGANTTVELLAAMAFLFSVKLSDLVIAAERRVDQNRTPRP